MRVLHLISGDLWAGAEVATHHLLVGLARSPDLEIEALLLNEGELARRLRRAPGLTVSVEAEDRLSFPELARRVRRRCRRADLVHAHRYKENLLAALSGRPWLCTQHGRPEPTEGRRDRLQRGLIHALDAGIKRWSAQTVVAVSGEVREWLVGAGHLTRTELVPNGIPDVAAGLFVRPWVERPRRVGALARLFPVKGLELAIDAVASCRSDVELEILGDGPERQALERRAVQSGCAERVRFRGHVADPLPLVGEWRALLVTSHHEGNPISVLEALALGTPIVSTALRGVQDILAGEGGILVPHRDPVAWARTLEDFLCDEASGAEASRRARLRFESAWTIDVAAAAMRRVYQKIGRGSA